MKAYLSVVFAVVYVANSTVAVAQTQQVTVFGQVVEADIDDFGVAGATAQVEGGDLSVVADAEGRFTLAVSAGPLVLLVAAPEHEPTRFEIVATQGMQPFEIPLQWSGQAESVSLVELRRRPETASTTRLDARQINAAPHRNAEEVLRQVPGLTLVQHGSEGKGHQFFLRGFDAIHGADLEMKLEGMPINEWSNIHAQGYLDLGFIIPELIHSVEVSKGPFTLDEGPFAMAGSGNYRLGVVAENRGLNTAYTIGTTNRHRVFVGYSPTDGDGQQFIGIEATHDDGFGENRGLNRITLNQRVRVADFGSGGALSILALGGYSEFELPGTLRNDDVGDGVVDFYSTYDQLGEGDSGRALVGLTYDLHDGPHDLSVTGYGGYRRLNLLENYTGFLVNPADGDRRDQFQETLSAGMFATHEMQINTPFALVTGLGFRGDFIEQNEKNVGRNLETVATRRDLTGSQFITYGIMGSRWTPLDSVRVDVGVRADLINVQVVDQLAGDKHGSGTLFVLSPRLTTRWQPVDQWRIYAAYGRGYRPPEARAFSEFDIGRAGIGEEVFTGGEPSNTVSDAYEFGTKWRLIPQLELSASAFATFIERESIFDHVSGVNLELNGTRRLGAEFVLDFDPVDWLRFSADATFVDARFVQSGNRVPLAPQFVSGIRATVTHPNGFRAGARVLMVAPRDLPHGATGATLIMSDLTLGYHWSRFRVDLEVENIFNQENREGEYHYASNWRPGEAASEIPVLHTTAGAPLNLRLTVGMLF